MSEAEKQTSYTTVVANLDKYEESDVDEIVEAFCLALSPFESPIHLFQDQKNGAIFCECHLRASSLVKYATPDTPLEPENSPEYRANRDLVEDHAAFTKMVQDALDGRTFSNIVCEFIKDTDTPLRVVGGQHRFSAIKGAWSDSNVDSIHGIKVYFLLDTEQRLDVQIISNTNIEVSRDLLDRMFETVSGADLRKWCQKVGLLDVNEDFADKRKRGGTISVKQARAFIINFYKGYEKRDLAFEGIETTPIVPKSGVRSVPDWEETKKNYPELWDDELLFAAGKEFTKLIEKQRSSFGPASGTKSNPDFAEKAVNDAIFSAWPYVAGLLSNNTVRLKKHFELTNQGKPDPLRAALLVKGRHITDAEQYRGLGYRTDPKERGRFVELFWLQAEKGGGFSDKMISAAIAAYHAKTALIEAKAKKDAI